MNYEHPEWNEFINQLEKTLHSCDNTLKIATHLLTEYYDVDVAKSINFLKSKGGYCDCEILMNVVQYDD